MVGNSEVREDRPHQALSSIYDQSTNRGKDDCMRCCILSDPSVVLVQIEVEDIEFKDLEVWKLYETLQTVM